MTIDTAVESPDDYPLAHLPGLPLWSENYATVCFDPANELGMMMHLGRWWADPTVWRETISLALPGERVVCIKNYGRASESTAASASMFRVEVLEASRRYRFLYDGPASEQPHAELMKFGYLDGNVQRCTIDLVFEAVSPPWVMAEQSASSAEVAGSLHVEQIGRGSGSVEFAGATYTVADAFMNRDHSRGARNMAKFKRHCWAQGYFADDQVSFHVYAVDLFDAEDGLAMVQATVSRGNERHSAKVVDIELIAGAADAYKPYVIRLETDMGAMVLTKAGTITNSPISFTSPWELHHGVTPGIHSALSFEEGVLWEWDGREGTGWSERAFIHEPFHQGAHGRK